MLNLKVWALSSACFLSISYTLCVLGGLLLPGLPVAHRSLELLLPGFVWISLTSFAIGLVETFVFGLYGAGLFVLLHNYFARRWSVPLDAGASVKAA